MKTLILILLFSTSVIAQDSLKVLFLGNSYTYVNDLPQLIKDLANSAGKTVFTDQNTPGGYRLDQHKQDATSLAKIQQDNWDFVVLQEQSQVPTIDFTRYNWMYPSAQELDSLITFQGSETLFFMTWGRRFGGQQCYNFICSPNFQNFHEMQSSLKFAYESIAEETNSKVTPVGIAWKNALLADSLSAELWSADDSHPSLKGSYLAACVFYKTFFNESPVGLTFTAGLDSATVEFLQNVADQTITTSSILPSNKPSKFKLEQNFPNPFNPSTTINYDFQIASYENAKLTIFNVLGEKVKEFELNQKKGSVVWSGKNEFGKEVASGAYFYKIEAENFLETKKMLLLK